MPLEQPLAGPSRSVNTPRAPNISKRPREGSEDAKSHNKKPKNAEGEPVDVRDRKRRKRKKKKESIVTRSEETAKSPVTQRTRNATRSLSKDVTSTTLDSEPSDDDQEDIISTSERRSTPKIPAALPEQILKVPSSSNIEYVTDKVRDGLEGAVQSQKVILETSAASQSNSQKGKGKSMGVSTPDGKESAEDAIVRLEEELQQQRSIVRKHHELLLQVQHSVTCQICLEPLHKPFSLSPCGHVACYDCLIQWFRAPPADAIEGVPVPPVVRRKKTCPHCRTGVHERPAEVWALKEAVSNIAASGLLVDVLEAVPADANAGNNEDPWKDIFHAPVRFGGLPPPVPGLGGADPELGMWDADDAVYRCIDCMHEIWANRCTGCGREYAGHDQDSDFSEDDDDMPMRHMFAAFHDIDDEPMYAESEDEDYESDFIDDGGAAHPPWHHDPIRVDSDEDDDVMPPLYHHPHNAPPMNLDDSGPDEDYVPPWQQDRAVIEISSDEGEYVARPARRVAPIVLSSDDEAGEISGDDHSDIRIAPGRGHHAAGPFWVNGEDEDNESRASYGDGDTQLDNHTDFEGDSEEDGVDPDLADRVAQEEMQLYGYDGSAGPRRGAHYDVYEDDEALTNDSFGSSQEDPYWSP